MTEADWKDLLAAARGGLCGRCQLARLVRSARGSMFVMCTHPELPKYQRQPVLYCSCFTPVGAEPKPSV